jgi:hypothetical protein
MTIDKYAFGIGGKRPSFYVVDEERLIRCSVDRLRLVGTILVSLPQLAHVPSPVRVIQEGKELKVHH